MDPRMQPVDAQGLPTWSLMRLWASVTDVPLRGDTQITNKAGQATPAFQAIWRAAFNRHLDGQIVSRELPTQYLLNAWREAISA